MDIAVSWFQDTAEWGTSVTNNQTSNTIASGRSLPLTGRMPVLAPRTQTDLEPLTFQQEWLWNLIQNGALGNYLMTFPLRVAGELDLECLRKSLCEVRNRHECLRTRIVVVNGIPRQHVDETRDYPFKITKVQSYISESHGEGGVGCAVEKFFGRRLNLAVDPVFDVEVFSLSDREHVLAVAMHHMTTDMMSTILVFRELWSCYANFMRGRQPALPDIPLQYADYAVWQRETDILWRSRHEKYWKTRLAGASRLKFPTDSALDHAKRGATKQFAISFGVPLSAALSDLASGEGAMLGMLILALYVGLVSGWCQQKDLVIPFIVAGRNRPEHTGMTGFFSQALFLRIELNGNETFIEILKLVTQEFFSAWKHLDFGRVSNERPDLLHGALEWLPWRPSEFAGIPTPSVFGNGDPGITVESIPMIGPSEFRPEGDMVLAFWNSAHGICGLGRYRADLFTRKTMDGVSRGLRSIAEYVVRYPRTRIASFTAWS